MTVKPYIEKDVRKIFEFIGNPDNDVRVYLDVQNPGLKAVFFKAPKLNYNFYQYTPQCQATKSFTLSQLTAYRTGLQPLYHEKQLIIRTGGFGGHWNFNNANTQFEQIITSIQPVFSKEHRNTFSAYRNEQVSNAIQEVEITNLF